MVAAVPDLSQERGDNVPVIVVGVRSLTATGGFTNLLVAGATIKNITIKPTKYVQLKWMLVPKLTPETSLLHGYTANVEVHCPSESTKEVKLSYINFAKITKPLLKDGVLNGEFLLKIRVSFVEFEDGTSWREDPLSATAANFPVKKKGERRRTTKFPTVLYAARFSHPP